MVLRKATLISREIGILAQRLSDSRVLTNCHMVYDLGFCLGLC